MPGTVHRQGVSPATVLRPVRGTASSGTRYSASRTPRSVMVTPRRVPSSVFACHRWNRHRRLVQGVHGFPRSRRPHMPRPQRKVPTGPGFHARCVGSPSERTTMTGCLPPGYRGIWLGTAAQSQTPPRGMRRAIPARRLFLDTSIKGTRNREWVDISDRPCRAVDVVVGLQVLE